MSSPPPTRADWVDRKLREAILLGELRPGERLVVSALCERWSVSPTPLREALRRLAGEGLVELAPQRGARVAPVSVRDCTEVYQLRTILEPLALRLSLAHADPPFLAEVGAAHDRLAESWVEPELEVAEAAHRHFHQLLLSRCGSSWMLRVIGTLTDHSLRYRLLSVVPRGGPAEVLHEHRQLHDACAAGDADRAADLLRHHLQVTLDAVLRSADSSDANDDGAAVRAG